MSGAPIDTQFRPGSVVQEHAVTRRPLISRASRSTRSAITSRDVRSAFSEGSRSARGAAPSLARLETRRRFACPIPVPRVVDALSDTNGTDVAFVHLDAYAKRRQIRDGHNRPLGPADDSLAGFQMPSRDDAVDGASNQALVRRARTRMLSQCADATVASAAARSSASGSALISAAC